MPCIYYRAPVFFRYFIVSVVSKALNALYIGALREKHRIVSIVAYSLLNYGNGLTFNNYGVGVLAYNVDLLRLNFVSFPQKV